MKKLLILAAMIVSSVIIFASLAVYADDGVSILVNDSYIETDTPPVIVDGRTLVPLRAVTESFGCDVAWDSKNQGILMADMDYLYYAWIDRSRMFISSPVSLVGDIQLDVPPMIINSRTMVPIRAISDAFGATVDWDEETRTVIINYPYSNEGLEEGLAEQYIVYEQIMEKKYLDYCNLMDGKGNIVEAEIVLENGQSIVLDLYADIAPKTVDNFVRLANEGFYDGLIFHRVIENFMIQGGGYDESLEPHDTGNVEGEFILNGYFNLIPHVRGVISMARAQDPNSGSSQFFIVHQDARSLDGQYAAFGRVREGMDLVDQIATTPTKAFDGTIFEDLPVTNQVIKTINIK